MLFGIEETRQKVDFAIAELERGEGLDGETVVNEILEKFKKANLLITQSQNI